MKKRNKNIPILVLGSRPEKLKKKFVFKKIYAANAAIQLANKSKNKNTKITTICTDLAITRDTDIIKIVCKSKPNRLIVRGVIKKPETLNKTKKFECYSYTKQLFFQSQFFRFGLLNILYAEFFIFGTFKEKIINIIRFFKHRRLSGVSTGFFSILFSIHENPNKKIIISGIGMRDEAHFYRTNYRNKFLKRPMIDNHLSKFLKKKYKLNLYSFDMDLVKIMNINL